MASNGTDNDKDNHPKQTPPQDQACLSGIRVVDFSRILAGPVCTMTLGDQGADVIKVERPETGDDTRGWGPPFVGNQSAYFLCCNRNKRSVAVDLRHAQGAAVARDLIAGADVVVENFKPGLMADFGLDYASLRTRQPGLVYCSISAYGQDGPYRDRPGYDMVTSAVGGLMGTTGEADGPPCKVGVAVTDVLTGVHAAGAIVTALFHRERTGRGQWLDCGLLDAQVASLANLASNWLVAQQEAVRWGTAHASIVPYQVFATQDVPLAIAAANDRLWARFCDVLGQPGWTKDPRFASNATRVQHRETLVPMIEAVLRTRSAASWMGALVAAEVPAGPVNSLERLFADPQVLHRDMVQTIQHPSVGQLNLVGFPVKYTETPCEILRPPPLLGQHTDEVLGEVLGYAPSQIAHLRSEAAVA